MLRYLTLIIFVHLSLFAFAQGNYNTSFTEVDSGWAANSVNAVVFRKNSLVTYKDIQYIAFYNQQQVVVVGKRRLGGKKWELKETIYRGNAADAHNTISIMVDGEGYLHLAWDHHGNPLNYCKSKKPGSLELTGKLSMTGLNEKNLTYPEFHQLINGDLLFFYRDGASGRGNLILNKYSVKTKQWTQVQSNLVDGEGKRNAYWQACVDIKGTIHLSWVWRESPDVASNHDMCYARSSDGGKTWTWSNGKKYVLPITAETAEYAFRIPQRSELINQTSICADADGRPFIATYWRDNNESVPQFQLIYIMNEQWQKQNLGFRKTPFSLSGAGTKKIPISRPQVITWRVGSITQVALIFRDQERGNKISVAFSPDIMKGTWKVNDLSSDNMGAWEPSYDTELWKQKKILDLFVQKVAQADGEGLTTLPPQLIKVCEWNPLKK